LETIMSARNERGAGGGAFLCGLLTGATLGAVAAMLFAPKGGSDLRRTLADAVGDPRQAANDRLEDVKATSPAVDKERDAFDHARGTV
jgi:gas vesicle protein